MLARALPTRGDLRQLLTQEEDLRIIRVLRNMIRNSSGFTLLETAVALGILSLGTGLVGASVFQVLSIQRYWQDDRAATKDLRHAGSWLAGDALRAENVTIGGNPTGSEVTITWNDSSGTGHASTYRLSGNALVRDVDGANQTLAEGVVSVDFSLSDRVLLFTMTVNAGQGTTETKNLQTYLRVAPS